MKEKIIEILKKHFPNSNVDLAAVAEEIFEKTDPGKAFTIDGKVDDRDDIIGGEEVTKTFTEEGDKQGTKNF